ncbi:MAG TPA: hypothetical protein HPP81_06215 [Deltaproteobacteria bacterium]|jgi:hypothetical protein|nr:hypothetical protein [Deltaproteobacteria bacterium]
MGEENVEARLGEMARGKVKRLTETFEEWRPKLEMILELGGLMIHTNWKDWGESDYYGLNFMGEFLRDTIGEFREAMYKAEDDTPEEKEIQSRAYAAYLKSQK